MSRPASSTRMISRRGFNIGMTSTLLAAVAPRLNAAPAGNPFEHIEVKGADALTEWKRLKAEGRGWPIIVEDDEELAHLLDHERRPAATILAAAESMEHPASLRKHWEAQLASVPSGMGRIDLDSTMPPIGTWPSRPPDFQQIYFGDPLGSWRSKERVHILLIPASRGYEVPAYLDWGGWNECPSAEFHVAALRQWHRDHGAELVAMNGDSMQLHVASRPSSREQAIGLAREQYLYAADIVDQGVENLSNLAASLMASEWWLFWWD